MPFELRYPEAMLVRLCLLGVLACGVSGCGASDKSLSDPDGGVAGGGGSGQGSGGQSGGGRSGCVPNCAKATCGSDGCDGVCGVCKQNALCAQGTCTALSGANAVVDAATVLYPIHPEIYGMAFADAALIKELGISLNRWGGNTTTRYNWQLDVNNKGNDWYYENTAAQGSGQYGTASYLTSEIVFANSTLQAGATTLMTISTIGYTPKDRVETHPFTCGYPKTRFPNQQSFDRWDPNCGNGHDTSGNPLPASSSDPTLTSKAAGPDDTTARVKNLLAHADWGTRMHFYSLDNEINLWSKTHRDVHGADTTYAEVWDVTQRYAPAIRQADPKAYIMGYGTWSAIDVLEAGTKGESATMGAPLLDWYLGKLADYEKAHGTRLIDCIDLHFYPQQDAGTESAVLNSPRSLWDPNYRDESYLQYSFDNGNVRLLGRVNDWINARYPGTGICLSEYNFFPDSPLAVVVQADVFGVLARENVRLAAWWTAPARNSPAYWAFRMYKNYDGNGAAFGDQLLSAGSTNSSVNIYAARRTSDKAITIMLVNRHVNPQTLPIEVRGASIAAFTPWTIAAGGTSIQKGAAVNATNGVLSVQVPARAVALLVGTP